MIHSNTLYNSTPKEPKQARSKKRLDLILKTAAQLFEEHGVGKVTTNDIAAAAKMSIGSLYRYFPDKNAILGALIARYLEQLDELFIATSQDPELKERTWQEVIYSLIQQWLVLLDEASAITYSRFYRNTPPFRDITYHQRQQIWHNFADVILLKNQVSYSEEQLQMIAGTCLVAMLGGLEAAHDMQRQADCTKKSELLRETAIMVGTYLDSSLA